MISKIALILSIVVSVKSKGEDIKFTKVSYTTTGKLCLSDCVHNKCYVDWKLNEEKCIEGEDPTPTYFTSQTSKTLKPTCLSNCGKFGYNYNWCFVDQDYNWDYCNPNIQIKWFYQQHISLYYGACRDACSKRSNGAYQCTNYHGYTSECDPRKNYTYVQAQTLYGDNCIGMCQKHNGEQNKYYWCEDMNQKIRYCALPAQPPTLNSFTCMGKLRSGGCLKRSTKTKRCISNSKHSTIIEAADKIEKSKYFHNVKIEETRNPVYSYTVKLPRELGEPTLPLVIKALITADTIRPIIIGEAKTEKIPESTKINLAKIATMPGDQPKQLIGNIIGGTHSIFNIIPQRKEVKQKLFKFERQIYEWVKTGGDNTAEVIVVIMYDSSTRPSAIGLDIVFYKAGKVFKMHRDEILHNLEKGQESLINEPKKIHYVEQTSEMSAEDLSYHLALW